jgi:hypothetical protein
MTSAYFEPTLERWEPHAGPRRLDRAAEGDFWEPIPAPLVEIVRVRRGTTDIGDECGDAGVVELNGSLPATSTYDILEFGIYFRVIGGSGPEYVFPSVPLDPNFDGENGRIVLGWTEGHPESQIPIDFEAEAFLVTNDLSIGPSVRFTVVAQVGTD